VPVAVEHNAPTPPVETETEAEADNFVAPQPDCCTSGCWAVPVDLPQTSKPTPLVTVKRPATGSGPG
jgi:hypothetical protein